MSDFVRKILTPGANISFHTLPLALLLAAIRQYLHFFSIKSSIYLTRRLPLQLFFPSSQTAHWYTISLCLKHNINGGWDNRNPRAYVAVLQGKLVRGEKVSKMEAMILRGQSCQANAFENIGLFAATLVSRCERRDW